jgi:hypothetical protein
LLISDNKPKITDVGLRMSPDSSTNVKVIRHLPYARAFTVMFILISGISSLDKSGKLFKVINTNKPTACDTTMS